MMEARTDRDERRIFVSITGMVCNPGRYRERGRVEGPFRGGSQVESADEGGEEDAMGPRFADRH